MNNISKDILIGSAFFGGLVVFISGDFIISSTLFATAAVASNIAPKPKSAKFGKYL